MFWNFKAFFQLNIEILRLKLHFCHLSRVHKNDFNVACGNATLVNNACGNATLVNVACGNATLVEYNVKLSSQEEAEDDGQN